MRKNLLPLFLTLSLIFVLCAPCLAQYNFYKYSFGVGGGITLPFADTKKAEYSLANQIVVNYYFTPYISTGIETQFGNMRGGKEGQGNFTNTFALTNLNAKTHLGQFYDRFDRLNDFYWLVRGLYAGAGMGIIRNDVRAYKVDTAVVGGIRDISGINHDLIFAFNIGLNLYLPDFYGRDRWEINFNMQFVTSMEDGMDGGLNPKSSFNDVYNYFSTGIRYRFGTLGLDKRKGRIK